MSRGCAFEVNGLFNVYAAPRIRVDGGAIL